MSLYCTGDPRDRPVLTHSYPTPRSSDLDDSRHRQPVRGRQALQPACLPGLEVDVAPRPPHSNIRSRTSSPGSQRATSARSEEHTSELQSLMRISYAVFCLKNKSTKPHNHYTPHIPTSPTINEHNK